MKDLVRRFTESLVRLLRPAPVTVHPYSCVYVAGPTVRRTGERPLYGEDGPLVRPYLVAHERQVAEARRRSRTLWIAVHAVDTRPRPWPLRRAEVAA
ncbi:hypothetical protein [Streptomyces atratus]|uniref:hypothetical protein n=1 Tax=Streptomyces atratus TaxID=1893 RepID=UPI0016716EF0|nr:hypothetical protein [Streptomyces atratus]